MRMISTLAKELYIPERQGFSLGPDCTVRTTIEFPDGYESHGTSTPKGTKQATERCPEPRHWLDRRGDNLLAAQ